MTHIHLATGLARRGDTVLLVASRYPSHEDPLWNLPGGRQIAGELLSQTLAREVAEETGLRAEVGALAYLSESYDGERHFVNATFHIDVAGTLRLPGAQDHVTSVAWIAVAQLDTHPMAAVAREPLQSYLRGALARRYAGFEDAGVSIRWSDSP